MYYILRNIYTCMYTFTSRFSISQSQSDFQDRKRKPIYSTVSTFILSNNINLLLLVYRFYIILCRSARDNSNNYFFVCLAQKS